MKTASEPEPDPAEPPAGLLSSEKEADSAARAKRSRNASQCQNLEAGLGDSADYHGWRLLGLMIAICGSI